MFIIFAKKSKTEAVKAEEKNILVEYFNSNIGKNVFLRATENIKSGNKEACPLHGICPHWFAKYHDKAYPSFFINPCWTMSDCLCPLRKNGCNCPRKIGNNPLC